MKKFHTLLTLLCAGAVLHGQTTDVLKTAAMKNLDARYETYRQAALQIWDYAEVGYKEYKSSQLLQNMLKSEGFRVEAGVAEIPTAFIATFGEGKPVIGILAEFDALPGLSQQVVPEKKPDADKIAGHACGHHLFGVASAAAAIELKNALLKNKMAGTIKLYGTPAEEGGSGKVYMVRAGLFEGVDVVLHWHPGSRNSANGGGSLANMSAKFRFNGISAHASASPERGRSALDGVEAMDYMVNMMREHVPSDARIHYVITDGGKAPNVVPDFAEVYYYVRHPEPEVVKQIFDRIVQCAEGKMSYEIIGGVFNLLPNTTLAKAMHDNLQIVGGITYTAEETAFAQKIQESFDKKPPLSDAGKIEPFQAVSRGSGGSTDVGDVSWVVPVTGLSTATWAPGTAAHSWQAVACGGMSIGTKGMLSAAKTLTLTGLDLLRQPKLVADATAEFKKLRGDLKYAPLLGDRKPALNYRDAPGKVSE
jgi:aminobenzoyl-glutamate utilization protein B